MKFVITTQELNYIISKCQGVISANPPMPLLSNLYIEAKNNELTVIATDLTVAIRCVTDVKVLEEGSTTLPMRRLAPLARELTSVNVEVSTDDNHVTEITADASHFKLLGKSGDEFPAFPILEQQVAIKLTQPQLKDVLSRSAFTVARKDSRPALLGLCMRVENGQATFLGTDGKRLSKASLNVGTDSEFSGSYLFPLKSIEEVLKNLSQEGDITIYLMDNKAAFEFDGTTLVTNLISEDYPDVTAVIPTKSEFSVSLHREELMTLLRQIVLFTQDSVDPVKFTFGGGEMLLDAKEMNIGEGKVSMMVNYHGPKIDIAFNPWYFLDILKHCRGEAVEMGLIDSFNPGVITEEKSALEAIGVSSALFILMPMRITQS